MNFLILQSDGEHKGQDSYCRNDYLRECHSIKYALEKQNIHANVWGLRHSNFLQQINYDEYDAILCIENYEDHWLPNLQGINAIKIYWVIDLHCQNIDFYVKNCANYDIILHSTKKLMFRLMAIFPNKKHVYFPNAFDCRYFFNHNFDKSIDIGFVGSKIESRKKFIEDLETELSLKYYFATGKDMIDLISSMKMHFNKNIAQDINYRTFETIGLGTCLITNYDEDLLELGFVDNVNCLLYKTYEECVEKIQTNMTNMRWQEIGNNGYKLAQQHSYVKRVEKFLVPIL